MSKFGKGGTNGDSLLAVEESGPDFGFHGGQHDVDHYIGDGMDGVVEGRVGVGSMGRVRGVVAQEVGWERGGKVMGAALGTRLAGALGPEVVVR